MPFFSITIPTFNHGKYLRECLGSIIAQDCHDYELLICNDASTDDTAEILKDYPEAHIITNEQNEGTNQSFNKLFKIAKGQFLFFFGSDDFLIDPTFLSDAKKLLTLHPETAALYAGGHIYSENGELLLTIGKAGEPQIFNAKTCRRLVKTNNLDFCPSTLMLKSSLVPDGFDVELRSMSDYFLFRALIIQHSAIRINRHVVHVRRLPTSFSHLDEENRQERKRAVYRRLKLMVEELENEHHQLPAASEAVDSVH